jgi:hypothetical protein
LQICPIDPNLSYPSEELITGIFGTFVGADTVRLYTGDVHHQKKTDRAFTQPVQTIK